MYAVLYRELSNSKLKLEPNVYGDREDAAKRQKIIELEYPKGMAWVIWFDDPRY